MQDSRNVIFNYKSTTVGSENCLTRTTRISPFHLSIFLHSTFLINVLLRVGEEGREKKKWSDYRYRRQTELKQIKKRKRKWFPKSLDHVCISRQYEKKEKFLYHHHWWWWMFPLKQLEHPFHSTRDHRPAGSDKFLRWTWRHCLRFPSFISHMQDVWVW